MTRTRFQNRDNIFALLGVHHRLMVFLTDRVTEITSFFIFGIEYVV
jgi:hypothetical protein